MVTAHGRAGGSGLQDGEDFDGQSTSSFSGLQSVGTGSATIGQTAGASGLAAERPVISNGDKTISVGGSGDDYQSLQTAIVQEVPIFLRHVITINVDETVDLAEVVELLPFYALDRKNSTDGQNAEVIIQRQGTAASHWKTDAIFCTNPGGLTAYRLINVEVDTNTGLENEGAAIAAHGGGSLKLDNPSLAGAADVFVESKGGKVKIQGDVTLGTDNAADGFEVKNTGEIEIEVNSMSGSVTNRLYHGGAGTVYVNDNSVSATAAGERFDSGNGTVYDSSNNRFANNGFIPYASGTATVSGGTTVTLDTDTAYSSNNWIIAATPGNNGTDNGTIRTLWKGVDTTSEVRAQVQELDGKSMDVNWATIKIA